MERELFDEDELLEDYIECCIEEARAAKAKAEKEAEEAKEAKAKAEKEAKAKAEKASRKKNIEKSIKLVKSKSLSIEGAAEMCEMSVEEFETILNNS